MSKENARKWELSVDALPIIRDAIQMHITTVVSVWSYQTADALLKEFESRLVQQFGRSHRIANVASKPLTE